MGSLKPILVPLNDISSLWHVSHTTRLGDFGKLAESTISPTVHVANKAVVVPVPVLTPSLHVDFKSLITTL